MVVDEDVPAAQVEAVIREAGGAMLRSTTLFDLYRGDQVGAGRKSLAYALTYQHDERTLTDDEAAKIRGRIVKKLRDALGAELEGLRQGGYTPRFWRRTGYLSVKWR